MNRPIQTTSAHSKNASRRTKFKMDVTKMIVTRTKRLPTSKPQAAKAGKTESRYRLTLCSNGSVFFSRKNYLLQEKVTYAPVIETPDEPSKVEARLMFVWPSGEAAPKAVTILTRLSKGAMMGVDFNKNKTWIGSSCGFWYASDGD